MFYGVEIGGNFKSALQSIEIDESFEKQDICRVFVDKDVAGNLDDWDEDTEIYVKDSESTSNSDARFGGLIRDIDASGQVVEIVAETFERWTRDGIPSPPGLKATEVADTDAQVIEYAVNRTPGLSIGTTEAVGTSSDFLFSHSSPASIIRKTARATGAVVRYNPDKTVDYMKESSMYRDRTTVTLSPSNQNISRRFKVDREQGGKQFTHLRAVGAGEGPHQVQVNVVPASDNGPDFISNYEDSDEFQNVVRYNSNSWSPGDRREWESKSNKDVTEVAVMEDLAKEHMKQADKESSLEVDTTIFGVEDVRLGDKFVVNNDRKNVSNEVLAVVELQMNVTNDGIDYDVTLSNKRLGRESEEEEGRRDLDRFNTAIEGNAVPINASGGRQPVGPEHDYQMKLYYPDEVEYEHRLNVRVMGLPYRAYSGGAAAAAGVVDNEIPFDVTTAPGEEGVISDQMTYPGVGEPDEDPEPDVYTGGSASDEEMKFSSKNPEFGNATINSSGSGPLGVSVSMYVPDRSWSLGESMSAFGQWTSGVRIPLGTFSQLSMTFDLSSPHGSSPPARSSVAMYLALLNSSQDAYAPNSTKYFLELDGGPTTDETITLDISDVNRRYYLSGRLYTGWGYHDGRGGGTPSEVDVTVEGEATIKSITLS